MTTAISDSDGRAEYEPTTISNEIQEKLIDEVLSVTRSESLAGDRRATVVMTPDGKILWRGTLKQGHTPAIDYDGKVLSLGSKSSFVAREQLERDLQYWAQRTVNFELEDE